MLTQRDDQTRFLRHRYELLRITVAPAREGLESLYLPGLDIDDRLEMNLHRPVSQGRTHRPLDRETTLGTLAQALVEVDRTCSTSPLRLVHGGVGVAQQPLGIDAPAVGEGHPKARGQVGTDVGNLDGGDLRQQIVSQRHHPVTIAAVRDYHELVATEAGQEITLCYVAQSLGDGGQQPVPGPVTEAVVDDLQVVDVDEQDRHLFPELDVPPDPPAAPGGWAGPSGDRSWPGGREARAWRRSAETSRMMMPK